MTPVLWVCTLLATTAVLYTATAIGYQIGARPGMALMFVGYVISCIGLIWDALAAVK